MSSISKSVYEHIMSRLYAEYGKIPHSQTVYNGFYNVTIERTPTFTVLWDGEDSADILAIYDWYTHIALDRSALVDGFSNNENVFIIENFFWFTEQIFTVPMEVLECLD